MERETVRPEIVPTAVEIVADAAVGPVVAAVAEEAAAADVVRAAVVDAVGMAVAMVDRGTRKT